MCVVSPGDYSSSCTPEKLFCQGTVQVVDGVAGAIVGGEGAAGGTGSVITAGAFIKQLRSLAKNKSVAAVVLRVDSPGGDALASDLMWREIRKLAGKKPVVASMGDVAASGGLVLLLMTVVLQHCFWRDLQYVLYHCSAHSEK